MKKSLIALAALSVTGCAMASSRRDYEDQARGHELRALDAGGLMATLYGDKVKAPAFMPVDGRAMHIVDKITLAANPTAADVINLLRIPGGMEVDALAIQSDDLDSNGTPTIVFSVGYTPCDSSSSLAASATYFAATGQTTAQAGGRLACSFKPKKFEEDVFVTVTIGTASATFAAGDIYGIASGQAIGQK
jgi:hypothetical protein